MRTLLRWSLALLLVTAFAAGPAAAKKKTFRYAGPHPLHPKTGKGMCFIPGPHAHSYKPHDKKVLYVEREERVVFVGDPTPFDDDAPRHVYYGHHPVHWKGHVVVGPQRPFCYISGPHHHWHPPAPSPHFTAVGKTVFYVGPKPAKYEVRVKKHRHVDRYYTKRAVIRRPVVVVEPPRGYFGVYVRGSWGHPPAPPGGVDVDINIGVPAPPGVIIKTKGKKWKGKKWKGKKWKGKKWKGKKWKGKKWKGKKWKGKRHKRGKKGKKWR